MSVSAKQRPNLWVTAVLSGRAMQLREDHTFYFTSLSAAVPIMNRNNHYAKNTCAVVFLIVHFIPDRSRGHTPWSTTFPWLVQMSSVWARAPRLSRSCGGWNERPLTGTRHSPSPRRDRPHALCSTVSWSTDQEMRPQSQTQWVLYQTHTIP